MIPRALNAPLSWIGLMRVSEHEAVKLRSAADDQLIRRLTDERDDWKRMANDFGERFNAAEAKCNKALAWAKEQHQRAVHMMRVESARKQTEEAEKKLAEARGKLDAIVDGAKP